MKKILIFAVLIFGVLSFSYTLEDIPGKWIDHYGDMLVINKRNNEYYADYAEKKDIDDVRAVDEYRFRNKKITIKNNKYLDVHNNGKVYFINEKGQLNVLITKTNKLLVDDNGEIYYMIKK